MMKVYNHGKLSLLQTFRCRNVNRKRRRTYAEIKRTNTRRARDARLLKALTK